MEIMLTETIESELENLMDSLEDLGMTLEKPSNNETVFDIYWEIISSGPSSPSFCALAHQLMNLLIQYHSATAQRIHFKNLDINNEDTFYGRLIDFVNAQGLSISKFSKEERSFEHHVVLLEFLVCEVQICRILAAQGVVSVSNNNNEPTAMQIEKSNSWISDLIHDNCQYLGIPLSSDNTISLNQINTKVKHQLTLLPKNYLGDLLFQNSLSPSQAKILEDINETLKQDYSQRKRMMIKRIDVTIQTFLWSPKGEENASEIKAIIQKKYEEMTAASHITLFDIKAARSDMIEIVKTSNKQVGRQTKSSLKTLVIGQVPDRGGRVFESRIALAAFEDSKQPKPQRNQGGRVQGGWQDGQGNRGKQDRRGFSQGWEGQKRGRGFNKKQQYY